MYLGSVKFYKHLIYLTMALIFSGAILGFYSVGKELQHKFTLKTAGVAIAAEEDTLPSLDVPEEMVPTVHPAKMSYHLAYPELYTQPAENLNRGTIKTAYLTFDDGPSARTLEILEILKEHEVKATFFVITQNSDPGILKRIVEEGHAIGIHTHTHKYKEIYRSVEAYLADFQAAYDTIYRATSVKPCIFRFPGGSINSYNRGIYQELISEMLRRGFLYYDWNVSTMDTVPNIKPDRIVQQVASNVDGKDHLFILAHDSQDKKSTVKALPEIIMLLKEKGYVFDKIDNTVEPVVFAYPD